MKQRSHDATEGLSSGGKSAELVPVEVTVLSGPAKGTKKSLRHGTMLVGSGDPCDLVVADRSVSRQHCTLELLPGSVRVRDLGSRNGTQYLGSRIEEARVPVGGTVKVGRTELHFAAVTAALALSDREELHGLRGRSAAARRLFALLERLGPSETAVLIQGETGSGKEGVARALHLSSPRAKKPLVVFDCGAVSASLVESELFGHVRGAFTGATADRIGAIESADGGTLFLDEIADLPLDLQPKLLRALDAKELRRLGDRTVRKVSMRVISATHQDLEAAVRAGTFRQDLYYRLAGSTVVVPPLRERPEDIALLARHFAKEKAGLDMELSAETLAELQCSRWPGNVRELKNAVERALTLGSAQLSSANEPQGGGFKAVRDRMVEQFERDYLRALLARNKGNVSAAAREAGLSRSELYRLIERSG